MSKKRSRGASLTVGSLRKAASQSTKTTLAAQITKQPAGQATKKGLSVGSLRAVPQWSTPALAASQVVQSKPEKNSPWKPAKRKKAKKPCCMSGCAGCPVFKRFQERQKAMARPV